MNKPNDDIELIRKYFNGELNPADQYELEKRALEDPFLQDAMDGYEAISIKQSDFSELENRLAQRLAKKEKVIAIWGFKQWSIAASLIFGLAALSIYFNQTPENKTIAVSELQKKERLPKSVKILEDTLAKADDYAINDIIVNSPSVVQNNVLKSAEAKEFSPADEITIQPFLNLESAKKDTSIALNEVQVVGYGVQNKREITGAVSRFKAEEVAKLNATESALVGRLSGVAITKNQIGPVIIGKVVSSKNGEALPGVQISNKKNGVTEITDSKGEFKIVAQEMDEITANYIGYLTETIAISKTDSVNIALIEDEKSLAEVVVTGYGTKITKEIFASPKGGWVEFRKYLDKNAKLENGQKGKVLVQFIIQPDGKLTNFMIQKSLSVTASNKAIQLIKNYQPWFGSADGKAQKAKVTVRFK